MLVHVLQESLRNFIDLGFLSFSCAILRSVLRSSSVCGFSLFSLLAFKLVEHLSALIELHLAYQVDYPAANNLAK